MEGFNFKITYNNISYTIGLLVHPRNYDLSNTLVSQVFGPNNYGCIITGHWYQS